MFRVVYQQTGVWLTIGCLLALIVTACTPVSDPIPTLVPTFLPPPSPTHSLATSTLIPTAIASPLPIHTATPALTAAPPQAVIAGQTLTLTLTVTQLNAALAERYAAHPLADYGGAPVATFAGGTIRLTLRIAPSPEAISLTLAVSVLNTTAGAVLDVRAVGLSALKSVTTQQVKRGHALLSATLDDLLRIAARTTNFIYTYVAVNADSLTLTVNTGEPGVVAPTESLG